MLKAEFRLKREPPKMIEDRGSALVRNLDARHAFPCMPRYHFDLVDRNTVADQGGHECAGDDQAIAVAAQLALKLHALRPELRDTGFKILVTDGDGEPVHLVPLDPLDIRFG